VGSLLRFAFGSERSMIEVRHDPDLGNERADLGIAVLGSQNGEDILTRDKL
jgi:hypothetical protein